MSALLSIKGQKAELLATLNALVVEAEESAPQVARACANIQRVYRGRVDRGRIHFKAGKATTIQRVFRGLMGRKRSHNALAGRNEKRVYSLFTYFAIQLQRIFRGYYSRKYRSNHADRKKFIGDLEETGRKVREMMFQYSMEQAVREEKEEKEKANADFDKYASNLHHLMSTKQIPGVFNPPEEYMETPLFRNEPVEQHVRKTIRDLLRTRGVHKTGLIMDMNGTRKVPLKGLKSRLSLQASAPYEIVNDARREIKDLHDILTRGKGTFFAGGRTNLIDKDEPPLSSGDMYVDANLNPLLKKGVPESQAQLVESARTQKTLFQPPLERPFYSRTGGNQSSVLDNGLFDIIADATVSGGVTQRALGTTARFGVADNCDNRPPGGVLPEPPIRASTIRVSRARINKLKVKAKPMSQTAQGLGGIAAYGAPFGSAGGNSNGNNQLDEYAMGANEEDWAEGGISPTNVMARTGAAATSPQRIIDPYASSDDEES